MAKVLLFLAKCVEQEASLCVCLSYMHFESASDLVLRAIRGICFRQPLALGLP